MSLKVAAPRASEEVNRVHGDDDTPASVVNDIHRHDIPMRMAKAKVGAAVKTAIGDHPLKQFGHAGLVSAVCSGEKVPDYLAAIVKDDVARRKFALALLEDDTGVVLTMHVSIPVSKVG